MGSVNSTWKLDHKSTHFSSFPFSTCGWTTDTSSSLVSLLPLSPPTKLLPHPRAIFLRHNFDQDSPLLKTLQRPHCSKTENPPETRRCLNCERRSLQTSPGSCLPLVPNTLDSWKPPTLSSSEALHKLSLGSRAVLSNTRATRHTRLFKYLYSN